MRETLSVCQDVEVGEAGRVSTLDALHGFYRLRLAGGGRGHDDFGNVWDEAQMVAPAIGTLANPAERLEAARIDYGEDRDYFRFDVPEGSHKFVRI